MASNSKCLANCSYCYTNAKKTGINFDNIIVKATEVWGELDENLRPFQIAIGGAGEPTLHPDFGEFVKCVKSLGILPNYTTNGMHIDDKIKYVTEKYCGGVAVSFHPHIEKIFHKAINEYSEIKTRLNTHVIVGEPGSLKTLQLLFDKYPHLIEYFVVLPYQAVGRAVYANVDNEWKDTFKWIESLDKISQAKFAFGALFYPWLLQNKVNLPIDIYEPEIYSGYRLMNDTYHILRKSSYDLTPKY